MMWSKLKQRIEDRFIDGAKGRVELFQTIYRRSNDQAGEYWLTIDGEKLHGVGTLSFFKAERELSKKRKKENSNNDVSAWQGQQIDWEELFAEGILRLEDFNRALLDSLNLPIEKMLESKHPIIRALGILDSRCGKRRFLKLDVKTEHLLVQKIHDFRLRNS